MHLVDDDVRHPAKVGVRLKPPEEDPRRAEEEPGVGALPRFKPDAVPHGVAYALAPLLRDALGDGDGAQPARLRDDDRALAAAAGSHRVFKDVLRHLRRLAAAGGAAHDGRASVLDALQHLSAHAVRGKVLALRLRVAPVLVFGFALLRGGQAGAGDFPIRLLRRLIRFVPELAAEQAAEAREPVGGGGGDLIVIRRTGPVVVTLVVAEPEILHVFREPR